HASLHLCLAGCFPGRPPLHPLDTEWKHMLGGLHICHDVVWSGTRSNEALEILPFSV
ncbi:hypothetical protein L9F63_011181, partial [Diploptera punctata]